MNQELFLAINSIRSPFIDEFMNFGTRLGNFWNMLWLVALLLVVLVVRRKYDRLSIVPSAPVLVEMISALIIGYIVSGLIVSALKFGLHMPRPSVVYGNGIIHSLESPDSPFSLPSGHSAFAMLVAATLWRFSGHLLRSILVLVVMWVGISRVNLGMHFLSDVILGYMAGLFGAWCAYRILTLDSTAARRRRLFPTRRWLKIFRI